MPPKLRPPVHGKCDPRAQPFRALLQRARDIGIHARGGTDTAEEVKDATSISTRENCGHPRRSHSAATQRRPSLVNQRVARFLRLPEKRVTNSVSGRQSEKRQRPDLHSLALNNAMSPSLLPSVAGFATCRCSQTACFQRYICIVAAAERLYASHFSRYPSRYSRVILRQTMQVLGYLPRLAFLPAKSGHVRVRGLTHPENKTSSLEKRRTA